jgi:chromate transporter
LAPDKHRLALALTALSIVLFGPPQFGTLIAILLGAVAGLLMFRSVQPSIVRPLLPDASS